MAGMLQQAQQAAGMAREIPLSPAEQQMAVGAAPPAPTAAPAGPPAAPAQGPPPGGPAQGGMPSAQSGMPPAQSGMPPAQGVPDVSGEQSVPGEPGMDTDVAPGDVSANTPDVDPVTDGVNIRTKMSDATDDEQKEYRKALQALSQVLYSNNKTNATIMQALSSTRTDKIDPIAKTGILLIKQLDDQIDLDESVVAQFTQDVTERLIELAEARYEVDYSPVEYQQALGTTWEGVMASFGVEEADYKRFTESMAPEDMVTAKRAYQGALSHG